MINKCLPADSHISTIYEWCWSFSHPLITLHKQMKSSKIENETESSEIEINDLSNESVKPDVGNKSIDQLKLSNQIIKNLAKSNVEQVIQYEISQFDESIDKTQLDQYSNEESLIKCSTNGKSLSSAESITPSQNDYVYQNQISSWIIMNAYNKCTTANANVNVNTDQTEKCSKTPSWFSQRKAHIISKSQSDCGLDQLDRVVGATGQ